MVIIFADKKLRKYANDISLATRKLGAKRAKLYQQRLEDLADSESFKDLEHLPGKYHPLKGDRKGQWSCDLDHPYRLIFEPATKPAMTDKHGALVLIKIVDVEIIEIVDYH